MTDPRPAVRRVARALALTPAVLVTLLAAPALASAPNTWPEAPSVSALDMLLVLVILPGALFIGISVLVFVPSMARGQKYQPGQAWRGESTWFGGPQDGVEAADRGDAATAETKDADRGGASARW
ncbi:MAG TPA: hypothetical protein VFJ09_15485 [Nocardioidaceae bacterium]|nr:hypothetical protein [Nocardioidaceae bacterium]